MEGEFKGHVAEVGRIEGNPAPIMGCPFISPPNSGFPRPSPGFAGT